MNIRIQFQPVHWIPCSFLCFCLFFFHLRSTMVANGMCLAVLLILVFPCSSLEGRCLVTKTQPVMSARRKAFTAGRKASCYSEQNLALLLALLWQKRPRLQQVMHCHWRSEAHTLVRTMCTLCLCFPRQHHQQPWLFLAPSSLLCA